jgi:Bacteriocin-protection, YdeI or OmpD-Associated
MLADKLHLKAGMRVAIVNAPAGWSLEAPGGVVEKSLTRDLDLVLLFATTQEELKARWSKAVAAVKPGGALWVAYLKKSSGIQAALSMGDWDATKGSGWNPVTMIGVDETWSAVRVKYAPGLEKVRHVRQQEAIRDADGTICVDRAARVVTAPRDLQKLIARNANARKTFDGLSFTNRKEYVVWILEAKKPETRADRLAKTVEKLGRGKKNPSDK